MISRAVLELCCFFFFSSRRRHTRFDCDWSSDVCSSDLEQTKHRWLSYVLALVVYALALFSKTTACTLPAALLLILWLQRKRIDQRQLEIGRASCRERV